MDLSSSQIEKWPYARNSTKDSVGEFRVTLSPRPIGGSVYCWEAYGEARRHFDTSLKADILKHLSQNSVKAQESGSYLSVPLFMVGKRPEAAKPTIMFVSDDKVARKEAFDLINTSGIMERFPGFEIGHCNFQKLVALADDVVWVYSKTANHKSAHCRRLFTHPPSNSGPLARMATAGGYIKHGDRLMVLTADHFLQEPEPTKRQPAAQRDDCDIDDDECEITGLDSFNINDVDFADSTSQASLSDATYDDNDDEIRDLSDDSSSDVEFASSLKSANRNSYSDIEASLRHKSTRDVVGVQDTPYTVMGRAVVRSADLDYALIEVDQVSSGLYERAISLDMTCYVERPHEGTKVSTTTPDGGTIDGILSCTCYNVRLPGIETFIEAYVTRFNQPLQQGDSGCWVRDVVSGRFLGHVFAGSLVDGFAVIMPARLVFEHARTLLNGLRVSECLEFSHPGSNQSPVNSQANAADSLSIIFRDGDHTGKRRYFHHDLGKEANNLPINISIPQHDSYIVVWIFALQGELATAQVMMGEVHEALRTCADDTNTYVLGNIKQHNVVTTCLQAAQYGTKNAGNILMNFKRVFSSTHTGLIVAVGGGVPSKTNVRLGDIIIGKRLIQYGLGKMIGYRQFQEISSPRLRNELFGTVVSTLCSKHELGPSRVQPILLEKLPGLYNYGCPKSTDFSGATYHHESQGTNCDQWNYSKLVIRNERMTGDMIHYGVIPSENKVTGNGIARDSISRQLDIMCLGMQAAGLMNVLPCSQIWSTRDYSNSHHCKERQIYAAYAKELAEVLLAVEASAGGAMMEDTVIMLATFALQSCARLCSTISKLRRQSSLTRALYCVLCALTAVLQSLLKTVGNNPDGVFEALKPILGRCGNVCKGYRRLISRFTKSDVLSWPSIMRPLKVKSLEKDMHGFKTMSTDYNIIFQIALAADIRVAAVTLRVIEELKITDGEFDWEELLAEHRSIILQGLEFGARFSAQLRQLEPGPEKQSQVCSHSSAHKFVKSGLNAASIQTLVPQLKHHENDVDKQMSAMGSTFSLSKDEAEHLQEIKNIRHCNKVVSDADDALAVQCHIPVEEVTLADEDVWFKLTTIGDLFTVPRINRTRRALGGNISDESYQQIFEDLRARQKHYSNSNQKASLADGSNNDKPNNWTECV